MDKDDSCCSEQRQKFLKSDVICRQALTDPTCLEFGRVYEVNNYELPKGKRSLMMSDRFGLFATTGITNVGGYADVNIIRATPSLVNVNVELETDSKEEMVQVNEKSIPADFKEAERAPDETFTFFSPAKPDEMERWTELKVLWEDEKRNCGTTKKGTPRLEDINPEVTPVKVMDRRFVLGQRVIRGKSRGKIIESEPLHTLKIVFSLDKFPMIITDVPVECIEPFTKHFYGVFIEREGWIGQITQTSRGALWTLEGEEGIGKRQFYTVHGNPALWISPQYVSPGDQIGFSYPYVPLSDDPYPGKEQNFSANEIKEKAIWLKKEWKVEMEDLEMRENIVKKNAMCEQVDTSLVVIGGWQGPLPSYFSPSPQMPPQRILFEMGDAGAKEFDNFRILYISPSMYLDKEGLAFYTGLEGCHNMIFEDQWTRSVLEGELTYEAGNTFLSNQSLLSKDDTDPPMREHMVRKFFTRYSYTVQWDDDKDCSVPRKCFGFELEPEGSKAESLRMIFNKFCFCKRKVPGLGFHEEEYGVVLEQPTNSTLSILWLRHGPNGEVNSISNQPESCRCMEIVEHPTFSKLRESRIVVKSQTASSLLDFTLGTVLSVEKWNLGKIKVHCAHTNQVKWMWPYQLDVFEPLSLKRKLELNLINYKKYTSVERRRN